MHRWGIRYLLDIALLAAVVVVVATGLLADRLDLHEFAPHRWAGYVGAALLAVHAGLHWRWLIRMEPRSRRSDQATTSTPTPTTSTVTGPAQPTPPEWGRAAASRRVALATLGAGAAGVATGWIAKAGVSANPYGGGDVGLFYHRESSLGLAGLLSDMLHWGRRPAPYKRVGDEEAVALPAVGRPPATSLAQALQQRRSVREYADRAVTGRELAWVLSAATGITSSDGYRAAPSAGALYPIETYVALHRVDGIDAGLYHLDVRAQALEPMRSGSVAGDLLIAGLGQDHLRTAPVVLILTGLFQRTRWKYHERHYRYVCWEGGHVAQNVYLAAEAAGLGACLVGAFLDGNVNALLRIDGRREAALALITFGPR